VVVPLPSSPEKLSPQHLTAPALVSAHVWKPPALIALTPPVRPLTSTGVELLVVVPSRHVVALGGPPQPRDCGSVPGLSFRGR